MIWILGIVLGLLVVSQIHLYSIIKKSEKQPKIEKGGNSWFTPILKYVTGGSSDDTYGKLGHMGIATVEPNGQVSIFEFGRYSGADKGYGITKSKVLGKIAEIKKNLFST